MATKRELVCASPHERHVKKMRLIKETLLGQTSIRIFFSFGSFLKKALSMFSVSIRRITGFQLKQKGGWEDKREAKESQTKMNDFVINFPSSGLRQIICLLSWLPLTSEKNKQNFSIKTMFSIRR
jgi:hypothetical protein